MGWEWHDRQRDLRGRFEGYGVLPDQIHIRVSRVQGQRIRHAAGAAGMELGEWCREVMLRELDHPRTDILLGTIGVPAEERVDSAEGQPL